MDVQQIPGLSIKYPQNLTFFALSASFILAFVLLFFLVENPIPALVLASSFSVYFDIFFLVQFISLARAIDKVRRRPLDPGKPPQRTYLRLITFPISFVILIVGTIQHGLLIAALGNYDPTFFTGAQTDRWSFLVRSIFQGVDTLSTVGFGPVRPLRNFSLALLFINILQMYIINVVILAIALSRDPKPRSWVFTLRETLPFASVGLAGKVVLAFRVSVFFLMIGLGFIEINSIEWILFGVGIVNYIHHIGVFLVYIYSAMTDNQRKFSFYVFLLIYADFFLTVMVLIASFSRVSPTQFTLLGEDVPWWTRLVRSLAIAFDTLTGYGITGVSPIANWGILLSVVIVYQGFFMRISVLGDIYKRFVTQT